MLALRAQIIRFAADGTRLVHIGLDWGVSFSAGNMQQPEIALYIRM